MKLTTEQTKYLTDEQRQRHQETRRIIAVLVRQARIETRTEQKVLVARA